MCFVYIKEFFHWILILLHILGATFFTGLNQLLNSFLFWGKFCLYVSFKQRGWSIKGSIDDIRALFVCECM
jgi:hypothetical protein